MSVTVRSFAKINLGLRIGAPRADGFHELLTVYQTIGLHDVIRVGVERGKGIEIRCADPRVPRDRTNTCHGMVERDHNGLCIHCPDTNGREVGQRAGGKRAGVLDRKKRVGFRRGRRDVGRLDVDREPRLHCRTGAPLHERRFQVLLVGDSEHRQGHRV